MSVFEQLPLGTNDIVFVGDSIFDFGEWHELMANPLAKNRAISGDDTHSVLRRIHEIVTAKPSHVVILLGINNFQKNLDIKKSKLEYAELVNNIISQTDVTKVWLIPLFPVNPHLYNRYILPYNPGISMPQISEVKYFNQFIEELVASFDDRVYFMPISVVLNVYGYIDENYTLDGLHLNGRGLREIAKHVKAAVETSP